MPDSDAPVQDTLAVMTAVSIENSDLSPREFMIVRLAALAAVDASAASYALNVEAATDAGLTLEDVQDVLVIFQDQYFFCCMISVYHSLIAFCGNDNNDS